MMHRFRIWAVVALLVVLTLISGVNASSVTTLGRDAKINITDTETGLVTVTQEFESYNSTSATVDLKIEVTNHMNIRGDSVRLTIREKTKSATQIFPGESVLIPFSGVECSATIVTVFTADSLTIQVTTSVNCP